MGAVWITNSFGYTPELFTVEFCGITYASIVVGGLILIHGLFLHGSKYNSVRIQTDLASASAMISGLLLFPLKTYPDPYNSQTLLIYDFFYLGLFPLVIQLCDNYMFYSRLIAISKVPNWKRYVFHIYVIIILSTTWFPVYSIIPFFYNTNETLFISYYFITLSVQVWGTVAYNFYFTMEFSKILHSINSGKASKTDALQRTARLRTIISIKSIIHCMSSSLASLIYLYLPAIGNPVYVIMIISAMHILFNAKIEKYIQVAIRCCPSLPTFLHYHNRRVFLSPSEMTEMNGLKIYRDVSVGLKTVALAQPQMNIDGTIRGDLMISTNEQITLPQRMKSPSPLLMRTVQL